LLQAGQPELIALDKALKAAMVPAGNAREVTVPDNLNSEFVSDSPILSFYFIKSKSNVNLFCDM